MDKSAQPLVPAFWASSSMTRRVPFIVSLTFFDASGAPALPPAVTESINRTVELTGRDGLATATVDARPNSIVRAAKSLDRAMGIPGVIVLFTCQSVELSEGLMEYLHTAYDLSLVRKPHAGQ